MIRSVGGAALALLLVVAVGCGDEVLGEFERVDDEVLELSDVFVVVGDDGRRLVLDATATDVLYDHADGAGTDAGTLFAVAADAQSVIATGGDLQHESWTSWDHGVAWESTTSADPVFLDMAMTNGRVVAVGGSNQVGWADLSEGSALTWHLVEVEASALRSVTHGGGSFMAVGDDGRRLISHDGGLSWDLAAVDAGVLYGVAYSDVHDRWVVVGDGGRIAWTVDGTWNWGELVEATKWQDVIWDGSQFVAVGYEEDPALGLVATSADGENWSYLQVETWLVSIEHHDGVYVGTTWGAQVWRSENLQDWTTIDAATTGLNMVDVTFAP